ncbi:MAG: hypothetical protein DRR19_10755 [Candidatus Parabeggiatoa sp. nov. 1]|nr:MAG: hypothetical protein DRR19_10755 [Gammaproteobacteria bacterium]
MENESQDIWANLVFLSVYFVYPLYYTFDGMETFRDLCLTMRGETWGKEKGVNPVFPELAKGRG